MKRFSAALVILLFAGAVSADQSIPDMYPGSVLYDAPREVIPGVWSAIGATAPADLRELRAQQQPLLHHHS